MKILITGARGFIGKNLVAALEARGYKELRFCVRDTTQKQLNEYIKECDFVFHLAGVNRPERVEEFTDINVNFTYSLLNTLKKYNNKASILMTSSIQATLDNPYGISKKTSEDLLFYYAREINEENANDKEHIKVFIYRLPNVFGSGCRPNYNSVIATFCYNIANGIPIRVDDRKTMLNLVYVDDVVNTFINAMEGKEMPSDDGLYYVKEITTIQLGQIVELIYSFHNAGQILETATTNLTNNFKEKLYMTYKSYCK